MTAMPGPEFKDYTLVEESYAGSAAVVFRGRRREDGAKVTIKIPRSELPSPADTERIAREYALLKRIHIRGVPKAVGLEKHGSRLALVMEELPGRPLRDVLRAKRLDQETILRVGASLAGVLGLLHLHGVVHRDIKPENILVDTATWDVQIVDFGAAAPLSKADDDQSGKGPLEGTLAYAPPEQTGRIARPVDQRADLYSLGVTLYEMLTGELPFATTDPVELIHSHAARAPDPPHEREPSVPRALSSVVLKLLEKSADDRYQSAFGLKADLETCLEELRQKGRIEPFPLGRRDRSERIELPTRLYGRDAEQRALLEAWERAGRGRGVLLLLEGPAGVGKSALVSAVHAEIARRGGYFAAGKFDQLNRSVPYVPLGRAFGELVRRVLTEPADVLAALKTRIEEALGPSGRVVADLTPEIEILIGPQPPIPEIGAVESQNRWNLVFQRFLAAFADPERPLTLFLDDLQWADPASLKLLRVLLTSPGGMRLLVIGAYREGEVDDAHPLALTLAELRKSGCPVSVLPVLPLNVGDTCAFIADALDAIPEAVAPLAALIHERTAGNPFFLGQLVLGLFRDGLLARGAEGFTWDLDAIRAAVGHDVGAYVTEKLRALPPETQESLELAACIGHRFDLATLALILERPASEAAASLEDALRAGLVLSVEAGGEVARRAAVPPTSPAQGDKIAYRFLHDRIQQAAYGLIDEGRQREVHLRIGRLLRARLEEAPLDEDLFAVVHHENLGTPLITDPTERAGVAARNALAGRRAKAATAYEAAAAYLSAATSLLGEASFEEDPATSFAVHADHAECAYLSGQFEEAERLCLSLLGRARSLPERVRVEGARLNLRMVQGRFADALELGRAILAEIGIDIPATDEACSAMLTQKLAEARSLIGDRPIHLLLDAPPLTDPEVEAKLALLRPVSNASYYVSPLAYALGAMEQVLLDLRHGHSRGSSVAFMCYGFLLASLLGQHEDGAAFGDLALALEQKYPNPEFACLIRAMFGAFGHYSRPLRTALGHLEEACRLGLELGDFLFLSYATDNAIPYKLALDVQLAEVRAYIVRSFALMERTKDALSVAYLTVARQLVENLEGRTRSRLTFSREGFDEASFIEGQVSSGVLAIACWYYTARLMALYLHGDYAGALEMARLGEQIAMGAAGQFFPTELSFFASLAAAAQRSSASRDEARSCDEILARHRDKIAAWAEKNPANFRHKHLLVRAETARLEGRHDEATDAYDAAIEAARAQDFWRDEAIAAELCARFHLGKGRPRIARLYMADAHAGYVRWGATAKVAELTEKYPALVPIATSWPAARPASVTTTTLTRASGIVDAAALIRTAQTLVGEVSLDRVLEQLVRVVVESAGAQRGVLLLDREGRLFVEARIEDGRVFVGPPLPVEESADLAGSIVRYVARAGEPVILGEAAREPRFAADPYLTERRPRSVLCLPMMQNDRIAGVLYLENNVAGQAFSEGDVELASLLTSLAGTAVENARLYARVEEATRALREANESLEVTVARRTEELSAANARLSVELEERSRSEASRAALKEEIIRMQAARLAELSAPIIPITDRIVIVPLIGTMDEQRSAHLLEATLRGAQANRAEVVILDATGMKLSGADLAAVIGTTASALRLIGARAIVTGLSPELAQALVARGADLGSVVTMSTLRAAVAHALAGRGRPSGTPASAG